MTTLKQLINTAMRKAKILASSEEAAPDEFQDVKADLIRMVDTWRLENLMIYANTVRTFSLAPGAASYSYGAGATFDAARPVKVLAATIKDGAGGSFPLMQMTAIEYSQLASRSEIGRPRRFYFEPSYPLAAMRFDKIPDDPTVEIVAQEPLTLPTLLTDELEFPPGYEDCLIHNLAVRICPDFGKQASVELLGLAASYKAAVKRANVSVPLQTFEHGVRALPGTYDINSGPGWPQ